MSDRQWHSCGVIVFLVTVLLVAVSGCSQATRHEVLTFFFTGVPEPGEEAEATGEQPARETAAGADTVLARRKNLREQKIQRQTPFFVHGPFGAGQCELCHATTASKPFRTGVARDSSKSESRAPSIGPRLAYPWEELCVTCHSEKSPVAAKANGLWQHEPVAKGWCTSCHSPHKSERQYMLRKDNNVELCSQCHTQEDLLKSAEHKQDPAADCISCHNPHVGRSRILLKAEYDEWQGFSGQ